MAYLMAAITFILSWLQSGQRNDGLRLASMMSLGLCLSKLEGALVTLFILMALIAVTHKKKLAARDKKILVFMGCIIMIPGVWILWIQSQGFGAGLHNFQAPINIDKIILWGILIGKYVLPNKWFLISLILLCVSLGTNKKDLRPTEKFLLILAGLLFVLSINVAWGYPLKHMEAHFRMDFPRMYLYATLPLCLFFASRLAAVLTPARVDSAQAEIIEDSR